MTNDPRTLELLDWSASTGQPLPRPATEILALEDAGHTPNFTLTVIGEATLLVLALDDSEVQMTLWPNEPPCPMQKPPRQIALRCPLCGTLLAHVDVTEACPKCGMVVDL
jgi:hypothetical protein